MIDRVLVKARLLVALFRFALSLMSEYILILLRSFIHE